MCTTVESEKKDTEKNKAQELLTSLERETLHVVNGDASERRTSRDATKNRKLAKVVVIARGDFNNAKINIVSNNE